MENILSYLHELNGVSAIVRLLLAAVLGGLIGLERGTRGRAAGLRTHILVCVGSAVAIMLGLYMRGIYENTDATRIAAQVISGVGFLGVGTIIVTSNKKIKGLTTAAGLWVSACVGLASGSGFYLLAIASALIILITLSLIIKIEAKMNARSHIMTLYIEIDSAASFSIVFDFFEETGSSVSEFELSKNDRTISGGQAGIFTIKLKDRCVHSEVAERLKNRDNILFVKEITN